MATGFLSTQWFEAIRSCPNIIYPQQCIDDILALIWDQLFETIWHCRNDILYQPQNHVVSAETTQMIERLSWYKKYHHELLDYRHYFLIDYDLDSLQVKSQAWRQARLTLVLDKAHHVTRKNANTKQWDNG